MSTFDWSVLGLSLIGSITAVVLTGLALAAQPDTNDLGDCILDLFVSRRITAERYFQLARSSSQKLALRPLEDTSLEDVGNVFFEEEDPVVSTSDVTTQKFTALNHVLVFKRGFAVKPNPTRVTEFTDHIAFDSLNPINFYSDQLSLKGQVVNPSSSGFILTGLKGQKGEQGEQGEIGDGGIKGIKGEPGIQGLAGVTGLQGPSGDDGKDGLKGAKGAKGGAGLPGIVGLPGETFDFVKIWPDQKSKDDDEATVPRPPDFPALGQYGLVSDDGKVYLSDGLNLTEVDDISEQGMHGEKGENGNKGEKGIDGEQGLQPAEGPKGDIGLKGFKGLLGLVKGEKGEESSLLGAKGDGGDTGDLGIKGPEGTKGSFSLDGFDEIVRPLITNNPPTTPAELNGVIRNNITYTVLVYNPVYSLPVRVYALGRSTNTTPTAQEIVNNGQLLTVPVDSDGRGNADITIASPFAFFTWLDNDFDPQEVRGPFIAEFTLSLSTNLPGVPIVFDLFIDGQYRETLASTGGGIIDQFTGTFNFGQSYEVKQSAASLNGDYIALTSDLASGTFGNDVTLSYILYDAVTLDYQVDSNTAGTITIQATQADTGFVLIRNLVFSDSNGGIQSGSFANKVPAGFSTVYSVSDPGCILQSPDPFITQVGLNPVCAVICRLYTVSVQLSSPQFGDYFTLSVNGGTPSIPYFFQGSGVFPILLENNDTYLVQPSNQASICESTDASGTIQDADVTVHFLCGGVGFIVEFNGEDPQTFTLALPNTAPETQTFPSSPGMFLLKGLEGDFYSIESVGDVCGPSINGVVPSNVTNVVVQFTSCPEAGFRLGGLVVNQTAALQGLRLKLDGNFTAVEQILFSTVPVVNERYEFTTRIQPNQFYEIEPIVSGAWSASVLHLSGYLIADQLNANIRALDAPTPGGGPFTVEQYEQQTGQTAPSIPGDNLYPKIYTGILPNSHIRIYCEQGPDGVNREGANGVNWVDQNGTAIYPLDIPAFNPVSPEDFWTLFQKPGVYNFLTVLVDNNNVESAPFANTLTIIGPPPAPTLTIAQQVYLTEFQFTLQTIATGVIPSSAISGTVIPFVNGVAVPGQQQPNDVDAKGEWNQTIFINTSNIDFENQFTVQLQQNIGGFLSPLSNSLTVQPLAIVVPPPNVFVVPGGQTGEVDLDGQVLPFYSDLPANMVLRPQFPDGKFPQNYFADPLTLNPLFDWPIFPLDINPTTGIATYVGKVIFLQSGSYQIRYVNPYSGIESLESQPFFVNPF